jgi:hypothetical protein
MNTFNTSRLRWAGWLIIASLVILIFSVVAFGNSAVRTPEFNQLQTVSQVAEYASQHRISWVPLNLGLLLGIDLTFAGLILIVVSLFRTKASIWATVGLICLIGSLALIIFSTYLLFGLAAGPDNLPPLVGIQTVSKERAVIGTIYEHISGLLATLGLMFVGFGLFTSEVLKRTGLIIAIFAFILTLVEVFFGAVAGPVVFLSLPIAIGLLRQKHPRLSEITVSQEISAALN